MPIEEGFEPKAEYEFHVVAKDFEEILKFAVIYGDEYWKDTPYRLQVTKTHRVVQEKPYWYEIKDTKSEDLEAKRVASGLSQLTEFHCQVRTWVWNSRLD